MYVSLIHIRNKGKVCTVKRVLALQYFYRPFQGGASFCNLYFTFVFIMLSCLVCSIVITCWERADILAHLCVLFSCVFVTLTYGVSGHVWYLIVSIPDHCLLLYFKYPLFSKMIITQSCQQFGLTEGLSAIMVGLLVSEAKAETQHIGTEGLLLAMIDSQKAFDAAYHTILMEMLAAKSVHPDVRLIVKNILSAIIVKWFDECSQSFPVQ